MSHEGSIILGINKALILIRGDKRISKGKGELNMDELELELEEVISGLLVLVLIIWLTGFLAKKLNKRHPASSAQRRSSGRSAGTAGSYHDDYSVMSTTGWGDNSSCGGDSGGGDGGGGCD